MQGELKEKIAQLTTEEQQLVFKKLQQKLTQHQGDGSLKEQKRLVAYIQGDATELDTEEILIRLKERLPAYMIPSSLNILEKIPSLPNGKIDKKALGQLQQGTSKQKETIQAPISELEQKLIAIWEEVLNFKPISVEDNFFEIGGDSILSIQILAKARKLLSLIHI